MVAIVRTVVQNSAAGYNTFIFQHHLSVYLTSVIVL